VGSVGKPTTSKVAFGIPVLIPTWAKAVVENNTNNSSVCVFIVISLIIVYDFLPEKLNSGFEL
jgi:tetrahydromethanopterin S-methyltransferase subunit E